MKNSNIQQHRNKESETKKAKQNKTKQSVSVNPHRHLRSPMKAHTIQAWQWFIWQ